MSKTLITILLVHIFIPVQLFASNEKLTITSGSSAPLIFSDNVGFYPHIVKELFSRLNIKVQTIRLPSAESLANTIRGVNDGVIGRVKGIDKKHSSLIRVSEKILDLNFTVYSNDKNIKVDKWADLKNHDIAYIRGWQILDNNVTSYKSLVKVKNPTQLFELLRNKRVDIILYYDIPGKYIMKQLGYYPYENETYLATREMFIYMHKKHSSLVSKIENELVNMKNDGRYRQLFEKYITSNITID